jgi:hypothetical protein
MEKGGREITDLYKVSFEDMGSYAWAGHKFVIHGYAAAGG